MYVELSGFQDPRITGLSGEVNSEILNGARERVNRPKGCDEEGLQISLSLPMRLGLLYVCMYVYGCVLV